MEKLNKIFSTAQIPAIDQYTIEHEPVSSLDLMERAATAWTEFFLKFFGDYRQVIVVAGSGNNGGDGYAIARLLKMKGKEVIVWRLMTGKSFSPDCERNYRRWLEAGGQVAEISSSEEVWFDPAAVVVDAIFGTGLNRPVTGWVGEVIRKMNQASNKVVAVDIPSGLMGEDNALNDRETIVRADYTFTFQFPKLAFMLPENASCVGLWFVLDIGLSCEGIRRTPSRWYYTTLDVVRDRLPVPQKFAHKGMNGKGVLIAGSYGMMGAAVLAAKAALNSGIGLLYCHAPERGVDILQIAVPEAILEIDSSEKRFSYLKDPGRYDAIAIGPALGQGPETAAGLKTLLQSWRGRTILDADALNLLAEHRELLELLHEQCILTPHLKEFERLAGKSENDFDRLNKLSIFANRFRVYVVLKGAHSVIATPGGELYFNMSGNPGMAKGGSGDVLTGILLALAANGLAMPDVARIGVFAHGLAGDRLVEEYGYRGISAGKIAEQVGKVWKAFEKPE